MDAVKQGKKPKRWHMGAVVQLTPIDTEVRYGKLPRDSAITYRQAFPEAQGRIFRVKGVIPGSPAASVFKVGDIIWTFDGESVGPSLYIFEDLMSKNRGKTIKMEVFRDGALKKVSLLAMISSVRYETFCCFRRRHLFWRQVSGWLGNLALNRGRVTQALFARYGHWSSAFNSFPGISAKTLIYVLFLTIPLSFFLGYLSG